MEFIKQNLMLVGLVVASGMMLIWPELRKLFYGSNEVGTLQATQLINRSNALLLDVREPKEFGSGHVPNSRNIPLGELDKRIDELKRYKDKPIVLSCRTGTRSSSALAILRKHQFSQVYRLKGGIVSWEQANLPIEKS